MLNSFNKHTSDLREAHDYYITPPYDYLLGGKRIVTRDHERIFMDAGNATATYFLSEWYTADCFLIYCSAVSILQYSVYVCLSWIVSGQFTITLFSSKFCQWEVASQNVSLRREEGVPEAVTDMNGRAGYLENCSLLWPKQGSLWGLPTYSYKLQQLSTDLSRTSVFVLLATLTFAIRRIYGEASEF